MLKRETERGPGGRIVLMDSISKIGPEDAGAVIVSASHGGVSSAEYGLQVPLKAVILNDAGVGKDDAGIRALDLLQAHGVAAGTVAHTSARIGDAEDMWENGVVSHVNAAARALGLIPGARLRDLLRDLVSR